MRSAEPDPTAAATDRLRTRARARFRSSIELPGAFFDANADRIARVCRELARAFHGGHRLLVFGTGAQRSDALHVAVEFVHPVIVGKRALPALALPDLFTSRLEVLGEPGDVALGLATSPDPAVRAGLETAARLGLATIALAGADGGPWPGDHVFIVPSSDPFAVQEVHETLYHVFWELVHVFLDHPGTLA